MMDILGVNQNNLRKSLFLTMFGGEEDRKNANNFSYSKYKYIIPLNNNFEIPLKDKTKDTYLMYWIEEDRVLAQDEYVEEENKDYDSANCVATVLLRFVGANAEVWYKLFRHQCKRNDIFDIWKGVCNAYRMVWTSPMSSLRVGYFGENNTIAYDIRIKLHYREMVPLNWNELKELDFTTKGNVKIEKNE